MTDTTRLEITLAASNAKPVPGSASWNRHRGGPGELLAWLETQLGLLAEAPSQVDRIAEYAKALDAAPEASFSESLAADRWGTAAELLARRAELRLGGWDGVTTDGMPALVAGLAGVAAPVAPDESDRLDRALAALDEGRTLPEHEVVLGEPEALWPPRWRRVLARLRMVEAPAPTPAAAAGGALGRAERQILDGNTAALWPDGSLAWVSARSDFAACEAIAAFLAREPARLPETVVLCEDPRVAVLLDASLARAGLPTLGASIRTLAHPALQVLPLALRLAWGPVDPETLLALLSLPQGPVPSRLAYALLRALGEQPGLGSQAWEQAIAAATADAEDPDGNTRQTIADWLSVPERRWGDPLPVDEVKARCQRVAAWAARRAGMFEGEGRDTLAAAYWLASGQAKALGDLAATTGGALSEAQLMKMLEAVRGEGAGTQPRPERAGAPRLARTLAEVEAPCARLIWLGLGTEQGKVRRWTALERAQLAGRGVEVDDGAGEADARRRAERRGLARASEALVAVALPGDAEKRPHPVWLQLLSALEAGEVRDPVALESLAAGDGEALVGPWEVARLTTPRAPQPGRRPLWPLPPGLLVDRDQSSASELEVRLQCPLRWVCYYQAGLRKGFVASLPADALLMGTFCHDVLRRVLGGGGPLPSVEAALGQVGQVFDERLPLDAAPLALPAKAVQALELRQQLLSATSTLVSALAAGGYRVAGMEVPVTGTVEDRALTGSIDCLGVTGQGEEAVVDLKYGKGSRAAQLEEGRALQLATYARARSQEAGGRTPAVGYLILREAVLHTPSGSRLRGDGPLNVVEGPAIDQVWQTFVTALRNTEAWLSGAEPVPARPLQAPEDWPQEVRLGLEGALGVSSYGKRYPACEYCDYGLICGLKELR